MIINTPFTILGGGISLDFDTINVTSPMDSVFHVINNALEKLKKDGSFISENASVHYKGADNVLFDGQNNFVSLFSGRALPAISLKNTFSLQILTRAMGDQVTYSHILGNHGSYEGSFGGFCIQQQGTTQNKYAFTYATETGWTSPLLIPLKSEELSYIVVNVNADVINIYVNNVLVSATVNNPPMVQSPLPLGVGNWIAEDRAFNGDIYEFAISDSIIDPEMISETWIKIQKKYDEFK